MKSHIQLTNTISKQVFDYYIEHATNIQLYHRASVLMQQLSVIENVENQNISFNVPSAA
jgi:hypothetical protein